MSSVLIKNTRIADPASPHNGQTVSLFIQNGIITQISQEITEPADQEIDLQGAYTSPGWLDIGAFSGDPGLEHHEDLESLAKAAIAGGFTGVACLPNTIPEVQSKSEIRYLKSKLQNSPITIYPIGAISRNCGGKEISEMIDMHQAGAVAFSDGLKSIQDSGMMMRALQYAKSFNGVIINRPYNKQLSAKGQVHEGPVSTMLGLKGIPAISEELMVQRDILLCEYTDSRLHIANVSSARSIELIRAAKAKGIQVTASVNPVNLYFMDKDVAPFVNNLKVMPPVRSKKDREALIEGLGDNTIDVICSNHLPQNREDKDLEFLYSSFGAIGLETAFAAANTVLSELFGVETMVEKLGRRPYELLGMEVPLLKAGQSANLTFFSDDFCWTFEQSDIYSKSFNSPFVGQALIGKVLGVFNNQIVTTLEDKVISM